MNAGIASECIYDTIAQKAYEIVFAVLQEGEGKYPNTELAAIVDRDDHGPHMRDHAEAVGTPAEDDDDLTHAITRGVLLYMRRERQRVRHYRSDE